MSDSSRFSNILIIAFFSAIALIGMFLINFNAVDNTVPVSEENTKLTNKVYLVDENTDERVSRIGVYIDPVLEDVDAGTIVLEYNKEVVELNDIYMQQGFTGLNQQIDPSLGKAEITFTATTNENTNDSFKLAELYFVRKTNQSFQVKLTEDTSLDSSEEDIVLNSLEVI